MDQFVSCSFVYLKQKSYEKKLESDTLSFSSMCLCIFSSAEQLRLSMALSEQALWVEPH